MNRKGTADFRRYATALGLSLAVQVFSATMTDAESSINFQHNDNNQANSSFTFTNISKPAASAARGPRFVIIDGEPDPNGGGTGVLTDGRLPEEADDPEGNFFFNAGTGGGRLLLDLAASTEIREINSFSWHPGSRGPQLYTLYASDGTGPGFEARPKRPTNPATVGWKLLATVDTRADTKSTGGQYAVHISGSEGKLGTFRYLLFDVLPTETTDSFGNTFYSEISVIPLGQSLTNAKTEADCTQTLEAGDGAYHIIIDTCDTPDLQDWTKNTLGPVLREWYPKIVALLPSEEFSAPKQVNVRFSERMRGVAATGGTRVSCAAKWFRSNLQGEACGSVVHELVHVVQQYGLARRTNPDAPRSPGWLVEGIADYIRWFLYEPQSHGADLVWLRQRRNPQLRYDAGYRVTANFLNWVTDRYDKKLVPELNASLRGGTYQEGLWQQRTGHSLSDLGEQWKSELSSQLGTSAPASTK